MFIDWSSMDELLNSTFDGVGASVEERGRVTGPATMSQAEIKDVCKVIGQKVY